MVEAAEVVEATVGQAAGEIARAIEPGAGPGTGTGHVGNEALGGQVGPAEIAAGQAVAADV